MATWSWCSRRNARALARNRSKSPALAESRAVRSQLACPSRPRSRCRSACASLVDQLHQVAQAPAHALQHRHGDVLPPLVGLHLLDQRHLLPHHRDAGLLLQQRRRSPAPGRAAARSRARRAARPSCRLSISRSKRLASSSSASSSDGQPGHLVRQISVELLRRRAAATPRAWRTSRPAAASAGPRSCRGSSPRPRRAAARRRSRRSLALRLRIAVRLAAPRLDRRRLPRQAIASSSAISSSRALNSRLPSDSPSEPSSGPGSG